MLSEFLTRQLEKLSDFIGAFDIPNVNMKRGVIIGASVFAVALGVIFAVMFTGRTQQAASEPKQEIDAPIYVRIEPGMTASSIGLMLSDREIIDSRLYFWLLAKMNGADSKFQTGMYKFSKNMSPHEVLDIIINGKTSPIRFTIPEGFNVNEIADRLEAEGIVDGAEFRDAAKKFAPYRYIKNDDKATYRAEGFLFPDTYEVEGELPAIAILQMMTRNFDDRLTSGMRERAKAEGLTIYDLVTLASLVEKEARYEEDRPIIAQVFLSRLAIGMPLQSDTTIQYLLDAPKEDVTYADTEIESPYNTYQHNGLPPGPIANPGMDSIEAVLYPAKTDYLYFVADRQGHNHYSKTYGEHLEIVERVR
ncbi:MAG: endolytic transglycosylase MltG [Schwartzia sp.]|nr:endolytic transglycosylase MltG [Schwartzia sp. (in: firmicutes)]